MEVKMSHTVNPELLSLASRRLFEKSAVVPPQPAGDPSQGGGDPSMQVGMPPMSPGALGVQQPVDPAQAAAGAAPPAGVAPPGMTDPSMLGALPPAQPAAPPAGGAAGAQKIKPEQMMQMLDYRLYNMQQQLTAIMNAMGVQVAPESLVLPPGTTGAPPAETALPGGPMAPPPAAGGGQPPADPNAMAGGGMPPQDPNAGKQANWWDRVNAHAAEVVNIDLQSKVSAANALHRNLLNNAR
jgi:putative serine protease PepD